MMEIKFNGVQSFMDLARYMIKQENRIKELERENYELGREAISLRNKVGDLWEEIEQLKYTEPEDYPVPEVTE